MFGETALGAYRAFEAAHPAHGGSWPTPISRPVRPGRHRRRNPHSQQVGRSAASEPATPSGGPAINESGLPRASARRNDGHARPLLSLWGIRRVAPRLASHSRPAGDATPSARPRSPPVPRDRRPSAHPGNAHTDLPANGPGPARDRDVSQRARRRGTARVPEEVGVEPPGEAQRQAATSVDECLSE